MSTFSTVYPTKASALNIPADGTHPKLTVDGVVWPNDSFTGRRLSDGSITTDATKAYKPAPVAMGAAASTASAAT